MRTLEVVNGIFSKLARSVATRRARSEFTCGDCERWVRCGLSPDEKCIFRAEQLARYEHYDRRPVSGPVLRGYW